MVIMNTKLSILFKVYLVINLLIIGNLCNDTFTRFPGWFMDFLLEIPYLYNDPENIDENASSLLKSSPLLNDNKGLEGDILIAENTLYCHMYQEEKSSLFGYGKFSNDEVITVQSEKSANYDLYGNNVLKNFDVHFFIQFNENLTTDLDETTGKIYKDHVFAKDGIQGATVILIQNSAKNFGKQKHIEDIPALVRKLSRYIAALILHIMLLGTKMKNIHLTGLGFGGILGALAVARIEEMIPGLLNKPECFFAIDPPINDQNLKSVSSYYQQTFGLFTIQNKACKLNGFILFTRFGNAVYEYTTKENYLELYAKDCINTYPVMCYILLMNYEIKVKRIEDSENASSSSTTSSASSSSRKPKEIIYKNLMKIANFTAGRYEVTLVEDIHKLIEHQSKR